MSRFVSPEKVVRIDLGNGEWVEVRQALSYAEMEPMLTSIDTKNTSENARMALPLLEMAITGWNLQGDQGGFVEFSKDKIRNLDMNTVTRLLEEITPLYFVEKKSSLLSDESTSSKVE